MLRQGGLSFEPDFAPGGNTTLLSVVGKPFLKTKKTREKFPGFLHRFRQEQHDGRNGRTTTKKKGFVKGGGSIVFIDEFEIFDLLVQQGK